MTMTIKPYHTHGKDDYGTPGPLYQALDQEFHLTMDVCADAENAKCDLFLTKEMDALNIEWWGRVFMNPPFSLLGKFLVKLIQELVADRIELGVALVAARSDTEAMFLASSYAGETRFLKGRVSYLVYPTQWQRGAAASLAGTLIDPDAWPGLVKEIQLPKTAILALMKDPILPGGHELLSIGAPFPSTVLIFDRRPQARTVYWDWKKGVKTSYVFEGKALKQFPWEAKSKISGAKIYMGYHKPVSPMTLQALGQMALLTNGPTPNQKMILTGIEPPDLSNQPTTEKETPTDGQTT